MTRSGRVRVHKQSALKLIIVVTQVPNMIEAEGLYDILKQAQSTHAKPIVSRIEIASGFVAGDAKRRWKQQGLLRKKPC